MTTTTLHDDVLVVTLDSPPVNALGATLRTSVAEAVKAGCEDLAVRAIVLTGAGRGFSAGADIKEFGGQRTGVSLTDLITVVEASPKPVVAALHGSTLGGGLELALGAHYRIAAPSARLGLPEVKLGLLPGAGGTQRLPRIIGVERALPMIVEGEAVSGEKALELGLVDRLAEERGLVEAAISMAREAANLSDHPQASQRTDRIETAEAALEAAASYRARHARRLQGLEAAEACIQAVALAAWQPFAEGLAEERIMFERLVASDQSKGLRHVFFAERAASRIEGLAADTSLSPIGKVAILGAGTMGGGIAMNFLSAGIPVTLLEREQAALDRGVAIIRKNYERTAQRGRLTTEAVEAAMALITPTLSYDDLSDADLIIEAVFESMDLKKEVFARLDAVAKPGAILASNTSYLDIDVIAQQTARPEAVIGMHFFSPANVMRLLEVVRGARTSDAVLASVMALARRIGKVAVVSGVCHGFIGNRMLAKRQQQAQALILEGAKPWDVDRVLTAFGFPMGPFQMADLAGLDIGWSREASTGATVREVLCEQDRRGQKTSAGYYDYAPDRTASPSPVVEAIIAGIATRSGRVQRKIGDDEILDRLLLPMINEGALILEEGVAQRASDIDVVWLNGYGWPARTGGPMHWAETRGLDRIVAGLKALAPYLGDDFRLSDRLEARAEAGTSLD